MKKTMLGVLAVIMILGSLRAFAMEAGDYELTEGKINAAQMDQMRAMIQEMAVFQVEADQLYAQDGRPRVGVVSHLLREAKFIYSEVKQTANPLKIDEARKEIEQNYKEACLVVRAEKDCK